MSRIAGFDNIMSVDYQMAEARYRQAAEERDEAVNVLEDTRARDLDETRRLLYMAMVASRTNRYNLVGTLVNALAHHRPADQRVDPTEAAEHLIAAVAPYAEDRAAALDWVKEQIARLTAEEAAAIEAS